MRKIGRILPVSLLFLMLSISPAFPAQISGGAYYWDSLEIASPAIFSINTTPVQTLVSPGGTYSFEVGPGTYLISAKKSDSGKVYFEDSSEITILAEDGEYRIDFILFPSDDLLSEGVDFYKENESLVELPKERPGSTNTVPFLVPAILAGVFLAFFLLGRRRKKADKPKGKPKGKSGNSGPRLRARPEGKLPDNSSRKKKEPKQKKLQGEAGELVEIIKTAGGRMSQRDLRKTLPYSEAKASLIVSELEARGIVKKYKRGRTNLLVLSEAYR